MSRPPHWLLVTSAIWLVLFAGLMYAFHPVIVHDPKVGSFALLPEPDPFWTADATFRTQAPFRVSARWGPMLGVALGPIAIAWLLAGLARRIRRPAVDAGG